MLPADYSESRTKFIALAKSLGIESRAFFLDERAGDGPGLSTDTAYLGPADAQTIVVISSGTHGVEGYAGAACQFRFMQIHRARYAENGIGYLLVHAVNPWGFFNDRRVTEEGIDLNRNFIDFSKPAPPSSGYDAYHKLLISHYRPLPAGLWNELRLFSHALSAAQRKSIQAAVTAGQYTHPDGPFFGGYGPAKSRLIWERIVETYASGRRCAFLLDIHTGLGMRGAGELMSELPASSEDFRRMSTWFGDDLKSMADGGSVSAALEGTLTGAFVHAAPGRRYAAGLEFGTRPPLAVLNAMRADHWYHNNASRHAARQRDRIRRKMKQAFSASDTGWHEQVIARFDQVMEQLARGLAMQSS
ncbi:MAG: hypothetical protein JWQ21_3417 [Herminiimonas sp.]|nr:hypothetical protein [Herminiimonas sp.]